MARRAGLTTYRAKRDFKQTQEPRGRRAAAAKRDSFVIQKHAARRLHYDLRLELDGVYKSWAVTKGPSLVPGEKRLAVHVEDHPLDYGDFEGTIPKGQYGGGTVIVWDRGRWRPLSDPHKGYAKGSLDFELEGEKLFGRWHLVRMKGKPREKRENWLLIKGDDAAARPEDAPSLLEERPDSVKTGRTIEEVAEEAADGTAPAVQPAAIRGARKGPLPDFVPPCLATLQPSAPPGDRWIHEIKFDGYRVQARIDRGKVKLLTRTGLDWTSRFGKEVAAALKRLPVKAALLDGELVVEDDNGASDFSALQADLSEGRSNRFLLYLFDLLYLDGQDLRGATLLDRKAALQPLLAQAPPPLRYSEHFEEDGALLLKHACRLSLEGVVSKQRDKPYRSGRNKDWIKSKCAERQEFVVCGYVPSSTSGKAIGSLVLGYYEKGKLRHAGRVGTGFSGTVARQLWSRLEPLRIDKSPFAGRLSAEAQRDARFVRPELVAEVEFRGWTADRHLRHAAFHGLREDKAAEEVVDETPVSAGTAKRKATTAGKQKSTVRLTHPDRLYWPDAGVTKAGLVDYYAEVWKRIAPFIVVRPLALLRCPGGVGEQCFFQKHSWQGLHKAVRLEPDPKKPKAEPLLTIRDFDGLAALVQAGVLELHPWGATLPDIEKPDLMTFDLDPGEGVSWDAIIEAAREVRQRLSDAGLESFVKTSGGKGLHVVAPLKPRAGWDEVKGFAKGLADAMAADSPGQYLAKATKSRRRGKIFVDYLRNGRGATAIAPYSTRARAGAPVSMPLAWEELGSDLGPAYFTVLNTPTRLAHIDDPWADFRKRARVLPDGSKRARRPLAG